MDEKVFAMRHSAAHIMAQAVMDLFPAEITSSATHALNVFGHPSETLWIVKLFLLSALFFYAFFNFTLSIRYYNHASLLMNVPQDLGPSSSVESVALILNTAHCITPWECGDFILRSLWGCGFSARYGCLAGRFWSCLSSIDWTGKSD